MKMLPSIIAVLCLLIPCSGAPLQLARDGKTDYVIVLDSPENASDRLAAAELAMHLKKITGADFPVKPDASGGRQIRLGGNRTEYAPQEYHVYTRDGHLYLTGGGGNGVFYAVYSFLEDDLGCRWFTVRDENKIPERRNLEIPEINRRFTPVFNVRHHTNYYFPPHQATVPYYFGRNKFNVYVRLPAGMSQDYPFRGPVVHSLFFFMPPGERPEQGGYKPWPEHINIFATHPEFYSLNGDGKRVNNMQLCFSNPEMRKMFTGHLLAQLAAHGGTGVVDVSATDVDGRFCHCAPCKELEKRYGSPGGPLFDYCIEAANKIGEVYPKAYLSMLAYRKEQSEIPPKVKRLPDNLIVTFAPIDADFATTFDAPSNRSTWENLQAWSRITDNLRIWYYPNSYTSPLPVANVKKLVHDIQLIHSLKVRGAFFEHDVGIPNALNFSDMQSWVMGKLFENPERDAEALIREFAEFYYGPAASEVLAYMRELDECTLNSPVPYSWRATISVFAYLTPQNLVRWQEWFDRLEAMPLPPDRPEILTRIRNLRVSLDAATLKKFPEIQRAQLKISCTPEELAERLERNLRNAVSYASGGQREYKHEQFLKEYELPLALAQGRVKPLPAQFQKIAPDRIYQLFPERNLRDDPDAAIGRASVGVSDELPMTMGVYDVTRKHYFLKTTIAKKDILPGKYKLYPVGVSPVSTECMFYLSRGWFATYQMEQAYELGNPNKKFDVYVSLKFDGPAYGGQGTENLVSCDRLILVDKN